MDASIEPPMKAAYLQHKYQDSELGILEHRGLSEDF